MIPKIFHFIWIGSDKPYLKGIELKIKLYRSDFEYWLWTDLQISINGVKTKNINEFTIPDINNNNSAVINNTNTLKSDLYRLLIMYTYGGIYSDLDSISIRKLPKYLYSSDYVSCYEPSMINKGNISGVIIGFFMCKKHSEAIRNLILLRNCLPYSVSTNKIGLLLGDINNSYILPSESFVPLSVKEIPRITYLDLIKNKFKNCYEVHLYHGYNKQADYEEKSTDIINI